MQHSLTAQEVIDDEGLDVFGQARRTPMVLNGMFLELTRQFYLNLANMHPMTKTWDPEGGLNHVFIESALVWDDENNNRRPAIFPEVGDLTYDPSKYAGIGGSAGFDMKEGVRNYNRLVTGSVVWMHVGKTKGQALQYAGLTLDLVDAYSDIILQDFCFTSFDLKGITKARQIKEEPREYASNVQADFSFQEGFQLKYESPKLKTITTTRQAL